MDKRFLLSELEDIVDEALTQDDHGKMHHSDNLLLVVVRLEKLIRRLANETDQK